MNDDFVGASLAERMVMRQWWSLHRTKRPQECDFCGTTIPVRKSPDYAEYWRAKGGPRGELLLRTVCCMCHALLDLPTDGWEISPNGREAMAANHCVAGPDAERNK